VEKGDVALKPVCVVAKPEFDARSPLFTADCCFRCAKMVGLEGLYYICPCKHIKCYCCVNNGVPCEPIPAPYKAEFKRLQTLFQIGALTRAFAAVDEFVGNVTAFAHSKPKPKSKSRAGSASVALSDEVKTYLDHKFELLFRNQERMFNYIREKVCIGL
jgi:hypothetical protein